MYIISRCLIGENCKYNGGNNFNEAVIEFCKNHSYVTVCPETEGGLTTPRSPSEIQSKGDNQSFANPISDDLLILSKEGRDVTSNFVNGAKKSLKIALDEARKSGEELEGAILKAKSPSCGNGQIYDGSFNGILIDGDGVFTRLLKEFADENGLDDFEIFTEKDLGSL